GEAYAPLRWLVEHLARQPYARDIFAFTSLYFFCLTTAPSYQEAMGHDRIAIDYDPERGVFKIRYCEWISPTRNPTHREAACRSCEWPEIVEVVDRYVLRLLLIRRSMEPFMDRDNLR